MSKDLFKIQNKADEEVDLFIYGDITSVEWDETDMTAMKLNDKLNELKDVNKVNLRVCSGGGNVYQGIAIYNSLKNFSNENDVEITATIDSIAASISSVIVLAADKVYAYESSDYMIHLPSMMTIGNQDDHRENADFLDRITEKIIDIYANKTGLDRDRIKSMMREETWMTGLEAYHYGFVDEVKDQDNSNDTNNVLNKLDLKNYVKVPERVFEKINTKNKNKGGSNMFKTFETEDKYNSAIADIKNDYKAELIKDEEFLNEVRTGYVKAEDILNKFAEIDLEGEDLDSVLNSVKDIKNDLTTKTEELENIKKDNLFAERKATLAKYGVEKTEDDKEKILNYTDEQFEDLVENLALVANNKVDDNDDGEPFDPNFNINNSDNSDTKDVVGSFFA